MGRRPLLLMALSLLACSDPARVVVPPRPITTARAIPAPAAASSTVTPPSLDDDALSAVAPETTVDASLSPEVTAQRAALAAWLQSEPTDDNPEVLRARLRAAGLLGLGAPEDYFRHARGQPRGVQHEAEIAARRRLNLHRPRYRRLGVAGSSVSAGFMGTGVGGLLEEAAPSAEVHDVSATLYFRKSVEERRALLDELVAAEPSFTLALDFLFWWTHGRHGNALEEGLRHLDTIPGIVVLGTVPRMTSAKRWIMSSVPSAETIARINHRIAEWAAARPRFILVPLDRWYEARTEAAGPLPGDAEVEAAALFAPDGLHLTALGVRFVVRRTLAAAAEALPDAPPPLLAWSR